jgi:hypothetical protein
MVTTKVISGKLVSKQKAARASHGVVNAAAMECRIFGLVMGLCDIKIRVSDCSLSPFIMR